MKTSVRLMIIGFLFVFTSVKAQQEVISSNHPVQKQLEAYNNRDINLFMEQYSDSVKVFNYPNTFRYQGKEIMRERYDAMFKRTPDLTCKLITRMAVGDYVIDQEEVTVKKGDPIRKAIAIYKIENNLIKEVTFISGK